MKYIINYICSLTTILSYLSFLRSLLLVIASFLRRSQKSRGFTPATHICINRTALFPICSPFLPLISCTQMGFCKPATYELSTRGHRKEGCASIEQTWGSAAVGVELFGTFQLLFCCLPSGKIIYKEGLSTESGGWSQGFTPQNRMKNQL